MSYRCGLIVGKFSPLHHGHCYLIDSALAACEKLVIISYAKPEYPGCDATNRAHWLQSLYPEALILVVDDHWFKQRASRGITDPYSQVPRDDAPEDVHRRFTAWLCRDIMGARCDAVFTSEDYGDGFAAVLQEEFGAPVRHICLDKVRKRVPVSATKIRNNTDLQGRYLPDIIRASFVKKLVFFGAESTGKTTICEALSDHLQEPMVAEYGRQLWIEKGGTLEFDDLLKIGSTQVAHEYEAAMRASRYLLCDTSPLTTEFYSHALFGKVDPALKSLALNHSYDHVFLCMPDIPFVQDGERHDEGFRARQHQWYVDELAARGTQYTRLSGNLKTRIAMVKSVL